MACPTRAVLTSPVGLPGVRLTFIGQGYRLVTRFLLTWFRRMVELGSRSLRSGRSNCFLEHLCQGSIHRKLLDNIVGSLRSLYLIVCRDNPIPCEINDGYYNATSNTTLCRVIGNRQRHTNVLCDNVTVCDTRGLHIKNKLCGINEEYGIVLTHNQLGQDKDNHQRSDREACKNTLLLPFVAKFSIAQQTYAKSPYPTLSHAAHVFKNITPADSQEQEIEKQQFHKNEACNLQRPYTESKQLKSDKAYHNSQILHIENHLYPINQARHNAITTDSPRHRVENQQHRTSEAANTFTTTGLQEHDANKQCGNSQACHKITSRDLQDTENLQCRISEACNDFSNSRSMHTENLQWANLINECHSLQVAKSAMTVLMCWRPGSRKGNELGSAICNGSHDNNCNNNDGESCDKNRNINNRGKDNNISCNKVEESYNPDIDKGKVIDDNNNDNYKIKREDDNIKKGENKDNNNNNNNKGVVNNKEEVNDQGDVNKNNNNNNKGEVNNNNNNEEEVNNNINNGEVNNNQGEVNNNSNNNNNGEVNNNKKGDVSNNNNNGEVNNNKKGGVSNNNNNGEVNNNKKGGVSNNNNNGEVNNNKKGDVSNNNNKEEDNKNNNKGEVNNNKGEVNNNNNNNKEEDKDTDCHADEHPLTASYGQCQTNTCAQTDDFVCDIMNTPTVLTSADRIYHLASNPTTRLSGIEPSRVDTYLSTSLVHSSNAYKQNNHANNGNFANFLTPSSDTDNWGDLLSRAVSIAGISDNDFVRNVDFFTEYPMKAEDSNPGFLDEADRFVETIFAESHRLPCAETGRADCAMSLTCTGQTVHRPVTPDTSTRKVDDATGLHLNIDHGTNYLLHNSRDCSRLCRERHKCWCDQPRVFMPRPGYLRPLFDSTSHSSDSFSNDLVSLVRPPESFSQLHDSLRHHQDSNSYDIDFYSRGVDSYGHPSESRNHGPNSFSHLPNSFSHDPNSFSNYHASFGQFPDSRSQLPDSSSYGLDSFRHPTDSTSRGIDLFTYLPDSTSHGIDLFSHLPDSTSDGLDSFSHLTDSTTRGIDLYSHLPDYTNGVIESFSHPTDSTSRGIDLFSHLPDSTSHGIDLFSHVPDSTSDGLDSFSHPTDSTSRGIDLFSRLPVSTSDGFDSFSHLPVSTSRGIDLYSHLPDYTSDGIDSSSHLLDATSHLMDSSSHLPDSTSDGIDSGGNHSDTFSPHSFSSLPDISCRLPNSYSELTESLSHPPDPFCHRSVSFSPDPDSYNGHVGSCCPRPDVSHYPDSWCAGADRSNDMSKPDIRNRLDYESHDLEQSKCKAVVSREQSCLNDVIITSLRLLNHSDPAQDNCLEDANTIPQSGNLLKVEGEQFSFIQDALVVKEALELLPDTELWSDQQTAPHFGEADEGKSRRQLDSFTKVRNSEDSADDSRTQTSDIRQRETRRTSFLKTGELSRVDSKQHLGGSNISVTRPFPLTSLKPGRRICSLTRNAPFKARSLVPINESILNCRPRTRVTTQTSRHSSKQRDCDHGSNKVSRVVQNSGLCVPLRSTKLKTEIVPIDTVTPRPQVQSSSASHGVPSADPPSLGQSTTRSARNSRNSSRPASDPHMDVDRMGQRSAGVDKRFLRKRKCAPKLTREDLTKPYVARAELIKPKLTTPNLKIEENEKNINGKTPGHGDSKNCISRCPLPPEHARLPTLEKSQKGRAVGPAETYTDTIDVQGKLNQAVVSSQRVPRKKAILESGQDRLDLGADVQHKSETMADSATMDTAIENDSVNGSSAGVRGRASWVSRFLETRDATVTNFTQQMTMCSPGLLKGRRSNDSWDKYQSRNKIATFIPKQVQYFKNFQLRLVRRQRNKLREGAVDQTVTLLETAAETDCNNHANYETPKPISTSRSKGKPKSLARQDFTESHEVNTNQSEKYVHFAKDHDRQKHQHLQEDVEKVCLPSIHREKTVSFRESPSGPVEKRQLNRMGLPCESSGSTLFSIILEEFRTSKGNTSSEKESPPPAHINPSAGTSQERNFLPHINARCVHDVKSPTMAKTALKLQQQGVKMKSSVKNDQCITNINNSRKMIASRNSSMNCRIKNTATKTQTNLGKIVSSPPTESPTGNVADGQLVGIFQHSNHHVDKCQQKAILRPSWSRTKAVSRPGAVRKSSTKSENDRSDYTDNNETGHSEGNNHNGCNTNIKSGVPASCPTESTRKCPSVPRDPRSDLSMTKCPVPKRNRPLKPEIARIVNRLASRPPSTDSKLVVMIGSWEREYGQPLNINQQLEHLVEARLQRGKPNPRRPIRQTGHRFRVPNPQNQRNPAYVKAVRAGQPPSKSVDSLTFNSPGVSASDCSQGPDVAGIGDGDDDAE